MLKLEHPAVMHALREAQFFKMRERLPDGNFVQLHHRLRLDF